MMRVRRVMVGRQTGGLAGASVRRRRVVFELQNVAVPGVAERIKVAEISVPLLVDPIQMIGLAFQRVIIAFSAIVL